VPAYPGCPGKKRPLNGCLSVFSCRICVEWLLVCWPWTPVLARFPTTRSSRVSRSWSWQLKPARRPRPAWWCLSMASWINSATSSGLDTALQAASSLTCHLAVQQNQTLADPGLGTEGSTVKSTSVRQFLDVSPLNVLRPGHFTEWLGCFAHIVTSTVRNTLWMKSLGSKTCDERVKHSARELSLKVCFILNICTFCVSLICILVLHCCLCWSSVRCQRRECQWICGNLCHISFSLAANNDLWRLKTSNCRGFLLMRVILKFATVSLLCQLFGKTTPCVESCQSALACNFAECWPKVVASFFQTLCIYRVGQKTGHYVRPLHLTAHVFKMLTLSALNL